MNKLRENKIFKIIKKGISIFLIVFVVAFITTVYLQRFSNNKLSILNYRMFTVATGSMVPKYKVGDVLFAKGMDAKKIKVGDDITYEGRIGSLKGKIVTHRVISVEKLENGTYRFHTKGLANIIEDPVVYEDQILGKIVYKAFFISLIYKLIATNIGFYLCIIIPIIAVLANEIVATLVEKEDRRRASLKK